MYDSDFDTLPKNTDPVDSDNVASFGQLITDHWVHFEVCLSQGEEINIAKVIGRSKDADGNIIGTYE